MRKIPTIFDRDYGDGKRGKHYVIDKRLVDLPEGAVATEKLDGTNVRVTIRAGRCVRLEKRRNPRKEQKAEGIVDPWYTDAESLDPADQHMWVAVNNTNFTNTSDGEWSGEAIGPKIQGNPLTLDKPFIFLFSDPRMREGLELYVASTDFDDLHTLLNDCRSIYNPRVRIEGIVWWYEGIPVGKIKVGDFE